jgi:alpha-ketoglutarate-dependent taurine dioxygenase
MATVAQSARLASELIKPEIGSRILSDKSALLSGELSGEIMELLEQRGILLFPQVHFTDEEQIAFTKSLGKFAPEMRGEEIYKITLDKNQTSTADYLKGTFFWHFDGFMNKVPIRASLLSSKVLDPEGRGQTEFANTYAAYDALPDERKAQLECLTAMHALAATQLDHTPEPTYAQWQEWRAIGQTELPLVWNHTSGRKSLVIGNSAYAVLGMEPLESKDLLVFLRDWATQERFTYSHNWQVGDAVMWDNTGSLHRATEYPADSIRMLHRTKLEGEEPIV